MKGMSLKSVKSNFFDRKVVINAVDRATRQVLSKFGAFVRTRARTSIRKRKGTSPPGGPPYSKKGTLKRSIAFGYDRDIKSVVIGPPRLDDTYAPGSLPALEYGGSSVAKDGRSGKRQRINVRPRPFMGPAFEAEKPGLPAMWKDSVK